MHHDGYNSGGYDWLAIWRRMYDSERDQAENLKVPGFSSADDCWSGQADRFAAAARRAPQPDGFMRFLLPHLKPDDRLLDIGAGTGRYELLLAGAVAEVLAIEPSTSMRGQLERRVAEAATAGTRGMVRIVPESWPEADVPDCDVVIAAHVLYGVGEIGPFLERMDAVARRACFLLLAFRHPSSFVSPFWERLHGAPRLPLPGALECLSALYQLGIPAQLSLVPVTNRFSYLDEREALADLRWRLRVPATPEYDRAIRSAMAELLERDEQGSLAPRGLAQHVAVVWWEH
jgi:SAM-dependent methyltransferase